MAITEGANVMSYVAGATFSTADMYKFVIVASDGQVTLPDSTGNVVPVGTLYGRTSTTSADGSQAVPVAIGGKVKVQMAASTLQLGQWVGSSTAGLGIAPTTDAHAVGQIVVGTSGAAGRINTIVWNPPGGLGTP